MLGRARRPPAARGALRSDHSGLTGPSGASFGTAVLYPFAFQSLSGQNVEAS